ncbi:Ig-like domain-containing protein [Mycoplasmatota bacterium]|nr:Ig-like domain-containing protein [Mycoplasmatota bacterium]
MSPSNATDKRLTYSVSPAGQGVSVDANGLVSIDKTTPVGDYTITAYAVDNTEITQTYLLTVEENTELTMFGINGIANNDTINATIGTYTDAYGKEIDMTDSDVQLVFEYNDGASDQSWLAEVDGDSVTINEDGVLSFIAEGTSNITVTPQGNVELAITFTVVVSAFDEMGLIAEGVLLNQSEVDNKVASTEVVWNTDVTVLTDWVAKTVNHNHGGSKIADFTDGTGRIVLEGHSTSANFEEPINMVWTKVHVDSAINSFTFKVRSHDDDRILESTNFRVRVITLGETTQVDELIGWTTVTNRWKQDATFFDISLDISMYQDSDIVIIIEQTGSLQNNGDWPKYSDSGAGAYLHLRDMALSEEVAPTIADLYDMRAAFSNQIDLVGSNWSTLYNAYTEQAFIEGVYQPMTLVYGGELGESLMLSTTSIFLANSSSDPDPMFYIWGIYPALNTSHVNNDVSYELVDSENGVITLANNLLTVVGRGDAELKVIYNALGSEVDKVELIVNISAVEMAHVDVTDIVLTENSGSYYGGQQFQLEVSVNPEDATDPRVTFSVADDMGITIDENGLVSLSEGAILGDHVITVTSVDQESVTAIYTLTVVETPQYIDASTGVTYKFATLFELNDFEVSSSDMGDSNHAVLNKDVDGNWNICLAGGDCDGIQAAVVLSGEDGDTEDLEANSYIQITVLLGENQNLGFVAGTDSGAAHFAVKVIDSEGNETILTNQETGIYQVLPGGYNTDNLVGNYDLSNWNNEVVTIMFLYDQFETSSSRIFLDTITVQ